MPRSSVAVFADPGMYQAAIGSANIEGIVTARGDFRAELVTIELDQILLHAGREALSRLDHRAIGAQRPVVYFLQDSNRPAGRHCGVDLSPGEIVLNRAGSTYHHLTPAGCRWADICVPSETLRAAGRALTGRELAWSDQPRFFPAASRGDVAPARAPCFRDKSGSEGAVACRPSRNRPLVRAGPSQGRHRVPDG